MRGFGRWSLILNLPNPLTPSLSPLGRGVPSVVAGRCRTLPNHTNPAACIAALRAPARRYCAAWPRGCPAVPATARVRHAIERAAQAAGRFAAAAALPAARRARAAPPQRERVAIAALLQRLLDHEAPRVFDRAQLRLRFHSRLQHGGQRGEALAVFLFGLCHGQTLPSRGAFLRPRFIVRAKRERIARL